MKPQLMMETACCRTAIALVGATLKREWLADFSVNHYGIRTIVLFGVGFVTEAVHF